MAAEQLVGLAQEAGGRIEVALGGGLGLEVWSETSDPLRGAP